MTKLRAEEIPSYEIDGETLVMWKDFARCWLVGVLIWGFLPFVNTSEITALYIMIPSIVCIVSIFAFVCGTNYLVYWMAPANWQDAASEVELMAGEDIISATRRNQELRDCH